MSISMYTSFRALDLMLLLTVFKLMEVIQPVAVVVLIRNGGNCTNRNYEPQHAVTVEIC